MSKLTDKCYADLGTYTGSARQYWYSGDGPFDMLNHTLDLQQFVYDRMVGHKPDLQCSDYAGIMSILGEGIGVLNATRLIKEHATDWVDTLLTPPHIDWTWRMVTNEMVTAPTPAPTGPGGGWGTLKFTFHQITKAVGLVYDPTMIFKYNPSGTPNVEPAKALSELPYIQTYSPTATYGVIDFLEDSNGYTIVNAIPQLDIYSVYASYLK
ncbi:MAG: hypothetical protein ABL962_03520 [Fimbriimonadaceae bacterium]